MKALVADDHPMVRDALARTVRRAEEGTEVHEAHDFPSAQGVCAAIVPEIALIDLNMPGMDGLLGVQALHRQWPAVSLIVASGQDDPPTIRAVLAAGARGFFPKSSAADLLLQAIRLVRAGGIYVPPQVLDDAHDGAARPFASSGELTPRQLAVLQRLMRGSPNKVIARELGLSEGTVKIHIAAILRALRVRNRTEAVVQARALGLDDTSA